MAWLAERDIERLDVGTLLVHNAKTKENKP
jgi:hypothetical protein